MPIIMSNIVMNQDKSSLWHPNQHVYQDILKRLRKIVAHVSETWPSKTIVCINLIGL